MWPCVTAIVNTYNRPEKLRRALQSVLQQTFKDFEVIVVHDGPPDALTKKVAEEYAQAFEVIGIDYQFIALGENSGYQCVPKNAATWNAAGDYIAYLDDDNEWTDDHLAVLIEALEEGVGGWPDFVYGRREYVDERAVKDGKLSVGPSPFVPFTEEAKQRLASNPLMNFIDTSDSLITKGALWRLQLATEMMWNESYRRFADWELFTRGVFFSGWRGRAVDHIVQRYYWHGDNIQLTRPVHESPTQKAVHGSTR